MLAFHGFQVSFLTEEADQPSPPPPAPATKDSELKEVEAALGEVAVDEKLPVHDAAEIRAAISRLMTALRNLDSKKSIYDKVTR
jgi:hypothetical protein